MRYALAITALVISGVLLLLGIGQRTFLAGPSEIVYPAAHSSDASYAVIPGDVFDAEAGQANVVVSGTDPFIAVAADRDIAGWTAPYAHVEFSKDPKSARLLSAVVAPETQAVRTPGGGADDTAADGADANAEAAPADGSTADAGDFPKLDPRGSDLWLESKTLPNGADDKAAKKDQASGQVRLAVSLKDGQSVLVASNGKDPLPAKISVAWAQDRSTPLAGPLLVAGGLFALIGGLLYLLAVDHDRRGLGPRRGKRGPLPGIRGSFERRRTRAATGGAPSQEQRGQQSMAGTRRTRRAIVAPALGLTAALALSGCSAEYWPDLSPEPQAEAPAPVSSSAPVPVTDAQLDRIIGDVAKVANKADESLDATALKARFSGDALVQRDANYKIRAAVPEYEVVPPSITSEELDYELVQSTEGWPRTIFATVASEAAKPSGDQADAKQKASPSLALVLTQANPHENFLVSRVVALRGGISMPEAAPAEEGTALLADDLQTLALPPAEAVASYAAILQNGVGDGTDEKAKLFDLDGDTLVEKSGAAWVAQAKEKAAAEGQAVNYSVAVKAGERPIVSLSTGVGGALVTATIIEERVEESGDGRWKPTAVGSVTALSGLSGKQDRLVREVSHQVLLFVPSGTSGDKIQLLGSTSELIGARN